MRCSEPQVPQPTHGSAGNRSQSAVTREETTPSLPGVPPAAPVRSSGLLSQQRCLICQRQTSPCLLQVIFPAILVLTAEIAVPAHRRGNARARGSGREKGWPSNAEKLLVGQGGHGEGQASQHCSELPKEPCFPALASDLRVKLTLRTPGCHLSPPARSPSLGRLSELCSPGLCLNSEKPVAFPSYLKRPSGAAVPIAMYTLQIAIICNLQSAHCSQTAQLQQWLSLPSFPPWCVVSVCRRFPFSLNEGKSAVVQGSPQQLEICAKFGVPLCLCRGPYCEATESICQSVSAKFTLPENERPHSSLHLLSHGCDSPEHPSCGFWGGCSSPAELNLHILPAPESPAAPGPFDTCPSPGDQAPPWSCDSGHAPGDREWLPAVCPAGLCRDRHSHSREL